MRKALNANWKRWFFDRTKDFFSIGDWVRHFHI